MRTKALILFFPFAVFLAETASFVPVMKEACAIITAKKAVAQRKRNRTHAPQKKIKIPVQKLSNRINVVKRTLTKLLLIIPAMTMQIAAPARFVILSFFNSNMNGRLSSFLVRKITG